MKNLFDLLKENNVVKNIVNDYNGKFIIEDVLLSAFCIASAYKIKKEKYLLVVPNLYKAQQLYSFLLEFLSSDKDKIVLFPGDELIRVEALTQSKDLSSERVYALYQILEKRCDIVITNVASLIRYLPNKEIFRKNIFKFKLNQKINIKKLRLDLISSGYHFVNKIDQSLQFAIRGDIIDIFSLNLDSPVRIELFDDEIESIRFFDIATQLSNKNVEEVIVLPGSDVLFNLEEIKNAPNKLNDKLAKVKPSLSLLNFETLKDNIDEVINKILEFDFDASLYKYFHYLSDKTTNLFDFCQDFKIIYIDKEGNDSQNSLLNFEASELKKELISQHLALDCVDFYYDLNSVLNFKQHIDIYESPFNVEALNLNGSQVMVLANDEKSICDIIKTFLNRDYTIMIAISSLDKINTLEELLEKENLPYDRFVDFSLPRKNISINVIDLPYGVIFEKEKIVILTAKELFNGKTHSYRYSSRFKEGTILKSYEELQAGDYVVHEFQGIGQFLEISTLEVDGVHKDYLKLQYANEEILYVPLSQFQLVRKYMAREGAKPKLTKLHSSDWEKTKKKIKEKINDLANRLYNLYQERSKIEGFRFYKDDELQQAFENDFPYELTKDQQSSLDEIKKDMESPYPMDRLLCGDVGFGKTEIAFRAAFKAILSGKQVAILCPTTILARQHYQLALSRFSKYDVKIAIFSRLINLSRQKDYIEGVRNGSIHLIIGTHRLLSKDISFSNLGLLIIDEEQRFGVEQKERLKELKNNVDVLTLSATPIPRTLQISLLGMRSLSLISTPIKDRMPVQTYVLPYKFSVVKELILRELSRQGQVFYLYNRVDKLYEISNRLQKEIPQARIAVGHGQMSKNEIEDVMMKFYNGEIDILVCTTIIENGIDVSNANMIIVQNADTYGLSQLYQIKGRVGRSDRIAYAYLFYNNEKKLTDTAKKRLKAIKEFATLGSGYKIAQRDLLIRGAGDILGPNQAGYIDSIGLDMYIKLLNEAVKNKINPVDETETKNEVKNISIDLNIDAYIDDNYAKEGDKIELYQQIEKCDNLDDLVKLKSDIRDIYGPLPKNVSLLFDKQEIDILVKLSQIDDLKIYKNYYDIILSNKYLQIKGIGNILFELMMPYIKYCRITYQQGVFKINMIKDDDWIVTLKKVLKDLLKIVG